MCGNHERVIPQSLQAALVKTTIELNATGPDPQDRAVKLHSFRMARALAFAAVCDILCIDAEALPEGPVSDAPQKLTVRAAVRKELGRG